MNSFWSNLYDRFKDRRYGLLFLLTTLAFFGLLILGATLDTILHASELRAYFLRALAGIVSLALAWGVVAFRRARGRRSERQRFPPLSSDEKRAARSKLVKNENRKAV